MTRVGIITQARMTSTRLPGKVLLEAAGSSMLAHHVRRLEASGYPVIVATTDNGSDDPIVKEAHSLGVTVYRGSELDVLSRFAQITEAEKLDVVVRVTSDCPLIDGNLVREGIEQFLAADDHCLYLSNTIQRTFPRGFDFEIMNGTLLLAAHSKAMNAYEREHVTPWIYESPKCRIHQLIRSNDASRFRITLDTAEDFLLIKRLFEDYKASRLEVEEIIDLLQQNSELASINSHIEQKNA